MAGSCSLILVLSVSLAVLALPPAGFGQTSRPIPQGQVAANEATRQAEKVEPPTSTRSTVSAAELQQQADELLALAQQVHTGTQRAAQGVLEKDLKDKLRRIEKLSKRLRDELGL